MSAVRRVATKTLGCRMNQHETDAVVTELLARGYQLVAGDAAADVYLINTCTITGQGDRKSRAAIRQAVREASEDALVIVTGCMAVSQQSALQAEPGVTYVVPNEQKSAIPALVEAHFGGEVVRPDALVGGVFGYGLSDCGVHTRQAVKIQDGCDNFCSYCIVPVVRGAAVSRPAADVLRHVRAILDKGGREIVLTGVNIGRYEDGGRGLEYLLEQILAIPGAYRVRISSIEPERILERVVPLFSDSRLCPHLHLCLQSGSDAVLKRMGRTYTVADYLGWVEALRGVNAHFNFTTDVIVGFPGESDADFDATLDLVRAVGFSHVHVFKYSRRAGTRADRFPDQVPEDVKAERSRLMRACSQTCKLAVRERMLAVPQTLLVEKPRRDGAIRGYTEFYHPVVLRQGTFAVNEFVAILGVKVRRDVDCTMEARHLTGIGEVADTEGGVEIVDA